MLLFPKSPHYTVFLISATISMSSLIFCVTKNSYTREWIGNFHLSLFFWLAVQVWCMAQQALHQMFIIHSVGGDSDSMLLF